MTKPHEQEWTAAVEPYGKGTRALVRCETGTVAHFPAYDPGSAAARDERARFIAAAPDMARALMGDLDPDGHVIACGNGGSDPEDCSPRCRKVTAALRKAVVLP